MAIKITETHRRPSARGMAIGSSDSTPLTVVVMGWPEMPITPHTQDVRARQPQHSAVTTVIAIATVRFSINTPPDEFINQCTTKNKRVQILFCGFGLFLSSFL
jgi:hypothetical protein